MNREILKLDAPYNIIYAGGRVGRHIATLTVWNDDDMGVYGADQYPILDEGGELAAGTLATEAMLQDCRVICNENNPRVRLRWLAKIVEYDFQQEEPVEFGHLWERLSMLGVKPIWDKAKNEDGDEYEQNVYEVNITFEGGHSHMIAQSYTTDGFYFFARGTVEEVYRELNYQRNVYEGCFNNDALLIKFTTHDGWEQHIIDLLNNYAHEYEPADDEDNL